MREGVGPVEPPPPVGNVGEGLQAKQCRQAMQVKQCRQAMQACNAGMQGGGKEPHRVEFPKGKVSVLWQHCANVHHPLTMKKPQKREKRELPRKLRGKVHNCIVKGEPKCVCVWGGAVCGKRWWR